MEAIIKFASSEFNKELFEKISSLLKGRDAEITIAVNEKFSVGPTPETNDMFWKRLEKSILDVEQGNSKIFTMDELEAFIKE